MKVKPIKFTESSLHRHSDYAPPAQEHAMVKSEPQQTPVRANQLLRTRTENLRESFSADFDDEFDGNLFDGVDITEHGEEVSGKLSAPDTAAPRAVENTMSNGAPLTRASPVPNAGPLQPQPRMQPGPAGRAHAGIQPHQTNQGPGRPPQNVQNARQPQTPAQQQNQARPDQNRGRMPPPSGDNGSAPRPNGQQQQNPVQPMQNQPHRPIAPQAQQPTNQQRHGPQAQGTTAHSTNAPPPNYRPPVGFVTSRAAELLQKEDSAPSLNHLPAFNPHAESPIPKEQRTPGVDHARSVPIKREAVGAPPAPQIPSQATPRPTTAAQAGANFGRPTNFVNPHQDANRRIGAPNYAMSPTANRGAYKPPTFANGGGPSNGLKRERPALQDVSNTGTTGNGVATAEGPDAKKQKVEATGVENAGAVST